ncbi:MAG: hypothetical protein JWM21_3288 [Acidobacteria bacterium]|nr:hypothetical protein [Acidobacteriota bacterium]
MKHHKLSIILFALLLSQGFETVSQTDRWLSYEPATVELKGRLTVRRKYGPPNYGEQPKTDAKVTVPVLVLAKPVSVRGTPGDAQNAMSVKGTRQIQLTFSDLETPYKQFIGKNIVVKGTLFHAFSGHHYTDVVMAVGSIEGDKKKVGGRR